MAYTRLYERVGGEQGWKNYNDTSTPLNADNLNHMDRFIAYHNDALLDVNENLSTMQNDVDKAYTRATNAYNIANTANSTANTALNTANTAVSRISSLSTQVTAIDNRTDQVVRNIAYNSSTNIMTITTRIKSGSSYNTTIQTIQLAHQLRDLTDVTLSNLQDGDAIVYNASTGKFKNAVVDNGLFVKDGIMMCRYYG